MILGRGNKIVVKGVNSNTPWGRDRHLRKKYIPGERKIRTISVWSLGKHFFLQRKRKTTVGSEAAHERLYVQICPPIFSSNVYLIWLASLGPYVCEAR